MLRAPPRIAREEARLARVVRRRVLDAGTLLRAEVIEVGDRGGRSGGGAALQKREEWSGEEADSQDDDRTCQAHGDISPFVMNPCQWPLALASMLGESVSVSNVSPVRVQR